MAPLTTGLIENTPVSGVRPTLTLAVRISNDDTVTNSVMIHGFSVTGTTKTLYVLETISILAGGVATRNYYAQFDAFEFQFTASSAKVEISAWGIDSSGNLTTAHRILPEELAAIGSTGTTAATGATGASGATGATGATGIAGITAGAESIWPT